MCFNKFLKVCKNINTLYFEDLQLSNSHFAKNIKKNFGLNFFINKKINENQNKISIKFLNYFNLFLKSKFKKKLNKLTFKFIKQYKKMNLFQKIAFSFLYAFFIFLIRAGIVRNDYQSNLIDWIFLLRIIFYPFNSLKPKIKKEFYYKNEIREIFKKSNLEFVPKRLYKFYS